MTPASNPGWGGPRKARPGKRMGKPPLHPNGVRRFYVNLAPPDLAWLDGQPDASRAHVVRRLIDDARQEERAILLLRATIMELYWSFSRVVNQYSYTWPDSKQSEANTALNAARAVLEAQAGINWLPIDTAPRNGTLLLLWAEGYHAGRWEQDDNRWTTAAGFLIFPTHWTPLPAAPEDA
jgi:hypothetical protein